MRIIHEKMRYVFIDFVVFDFYMTVLLRHCNEGCVADVSSEYDVNIVTILSVFRKMFSGVEVK